MRTSGWVLCLFGVLSWSGCSLTSEFGDFTFGQVERDGGVSDDMGGGNGPGGGAKDGGPDPDDDDKGGGRDGGATNGDTTGGGMDAGPMPDPLCEAAKDKCDPVATCSSATGVAVCTCPRGYYDANGDGSDCIDLDECRAGIANCDEDATCTNTPGAYECNCNPGFIRDASSGECLDSCAVLIATTCDVNVGICTKPDGVATCRCPSGYVDINGDGTQCEPDAGCMALECDPLALCDSANPACVCPNGYTGDGKTCVDVNECDAGTDDCADQATCTNSSGGFSCGCKTGYAGDGKTCSDVDECAAGIDTCSSNATCTNTTGAFTCACNNGYTGDGSTCADINECQLGTSNCSSNANCINDSGSFSCSCKTGYSGNGVTCDDVDECRAGTDTCADNEQCTNTAGSFTCGCDAGYRKNTQGTCVDVNECDENLDNCSDNATCTNNTGSFTCACKNGYSGDGVTCADINECAPGGANNCSANATCNNTAGAFTCACNAGYSGDGVTCSDIDECASAATNNCHPTRAICTNQPPPTRFTCACKTGYTGDGITCTDVNECALNTDGCDPLPDACVNSEGAFACVCPPGYSGTGMGANGCCTPDTSSDLASPNDGRDNECDGFTDRPVINTGTTFPESGGAAAGSHVSIAVMPSTIAGAQLQCRTFKRSASLLPNFGPCANPALPAIADVAANDGAYRTELRWRFSDAKGQYISHTTSYDYYVHSSLASAQRCPSLGATDEQLFKFADAQLAASLVGAGYTDPGNFLLGTDTFLANPFVSIGYRPLALHQFTLRGKAVDVASGSTYAADIMSLRHRFVSNGRYVLIRRVYGSRAAGGSSAYCKAARFEVSASYWQKNRSGFWSERYTGHDCDVVVLNRAGAGACILALGGKLAFGPARAALSFGYGASNKYMWRQLMEERRSGLGVESGFTNFSPKCASTGCSTGNENLYLPDRSILRP